jgi:hypothetical protein
LFLRLQKFEEIYDIRSNLLRPLQTYSRLRMNHYIPSAIQKFFALSNRLANLSFQSISPSCLSETSADGDTKPATIQLIAAIEQQQLLYGPSPADFVDAPIVSGFEKPCAFGKAAVQAVRLYGIKRLRPLSRRRLRTNRPDLVAIRLRKPWVLARLRRFGRKVGSISNSAPEFSSPVALAALPHTHFHITTLSLRATLQTGFIARAFLGCQIQLEI